MKIYFLVFACLLTKATIAQQDRLYTFDAVGWTVSLPQDFEMQDSATSADKSEKGKKAIEDANDVKADISSTKTLFSATKNRFNLVNATITPYDPDTDGDFDVVSRGVKDMIYKTLVDQMPDARFDTASSKVKIGGIEFDKFRVGVIMKDKTIFNMCLLSKLYKGYDFGITYLYLDDQTRRDVETALGNSKFASAAAPVVQNFNFQKIKTKDIDALRIADGSQFYVYDYSISPSADYFPGRPSFDLAQPLIYRRMDGSFETETSYYFSKSDSAVRMIEYQWQGTKRMSEAEYNDIREKNKKIISAYFKSAAKEIPETDEKAAKDIWEDSSVYVQQLYMPNLRRIRVLVSWK